MRAILLGRDQIYISPLDLNVEAGYIEEPLKPVMRFATPVFDRLGRKQRIVVLNYFGDRLIGNFVRAAANIAGPPPRNSIRARRIAMGSRTGLT